MLSRLVHSTALTILMGETAHRKSRIFAAASPARPRILNQAAWHVQTKTEKLLPDIVRPVVRSFVDAHSFQAQMIAIGILIGRVKKSKCDFRKILSRWHGVKNNRLVIRQTAQKIAYRPVAPIGQKSMIPSIDQTRFGNALDVGEVHHHTLFG